MQLGGDPLVFLGTEIGRLVLVFLFFHYVVLSTKKELATFVTDIQSQMHILTESVNKIFIRLAENESLREKVSELKEKNNGIEERLRRLEQRNREI